MEYLEILIDPQCALPKYADSFVLPAQNIDAHVRVLRKYLTLFPAERNVIIGRITPQTPREVVMELISGAEIGKIMTLYPEALEVLLERAAPRIRLYYRILSGEKDNIRKVSVQALEAALLCGNRELVERAADSERSYTNVKMAYIEHAVEWTTVDVGVLLRIRGLESRVAKLCVIYKVPIRAPRSLRKKYLLGLHAVMHHDNSAYLERNLESRYKFSVTIIEAAIKYERGQVIRHIARHAEYINIEHYLQMLPHIRRASEARITGKSNQAENARRTRRWVSSVTWTSYMENPMNMVPKRCSFNHRDMILTCLIVSDPKVVTMRKYGNRVLSRQFLRRSIKHNYRDDLTLLMEKSAQISESPSGIKS